ncbi:hypothetical protein MBLNU457_7024t1 [Dothideomycetes sp. NU457]
MNRRRAFPPARPVETVPLPPNVALSTLQTFLTATEKYPYLHPDSLIQPGGVKFASSGNGPTGGLILHHLRRIAAGLNGESLIPEPDDIFTLYPEARTSDDTRLDAEIRREMLPRKRKPMNELDEFGTPKKSALKKAKVNIEDANVDSEGEVLHSARNDADFDPFEGEEDPDQFRLKQEPLEGDVGEVDPSHGRQTGATQPPAVMAHQDVENMDTQDVEKMNTSLSQADKELRKAEKKKRQKEEKRAKEIKRAGG